MHRLSAHAESCNRSTSDCYSRHRGTTIWEELKEYPAIRSYPPSLICKFQFPSDVAGAFVHFWVTTVQKRAKFETSGW
jgi:hypothetical protein